MPEKQNFLDRAINFISPSWGNKRLLEREKRELFNKQKRGYEAASKGRRTQNWRAPSSSAPAEIDRALTDLRNRSRDLARNNPYARRALKKTANTVVGTGIIPTPILSSAPQEKKIKALWNAWADETSADYDGHLNYYGLQRLIMRTVAESGECIVRKRIVKDPSLPIPLQLQVLEGDFIATIHHTPKADANGNYVLYGIEFNQQHKVVAYWLYDEHPGDNFRFSISYQRYAVEDIIHVFEKERPGQFRGVPFGAAAMLRLKDLDEYEDAQLIRQKIAACFSVFVTDATSPIPGVSTTDEDGDPLEKVEPGIIEHLKPGQTVTMATPPGAEGYGDYTKNVLRAVAVGYDMDYIGLSGDYSQATFSSARMSWLDFHLNVADWQWNMLIPMACAKTWKWFLQIAAIYGEVRAGQSIGVSWSVPRRQMINPVDETKALVDGMQNGLITWTDVQLEQGLNPDEQIEKMKKDKEAFEKAGLPFYTSKPAGGAQQDKQPNDKAQSQ